MSELVELDSLIKELEDVDILSLYQDKEHAVEISHKDDVFYVRLDGANIYAGPDGEKAASVFYSQISQIHDDAKRGSDPSFATLREILQARNAHVKDMLAAIGHDHLSASLNGIEFAKEFNIDGFLDVIKHNKSNLDVLDFANYRPAEQENEECHTCIFFAAGGYCTKLDLPVKEEMYCDLFKPLPMADKNEKWAEASQQPWEEEQEDTIDGVQKDVRELLYTSNELEAPANFDSSQRKINVIMREYIPDGADEGFAFLVKNAGPSGVEIRLTQHEGHWYALSKQRDMSDLGDPFQSVGDAYQPKHVKLREEEDREGKEKLQEVRGQDDEFQNQYNPEIGIDEPLTPQDRGIISINDDMKPEPDTGGGTREVADTDVSNPGNIDTDRKTIKRKQYENLGLDKYHPEDDFSTDTEIEKDLTITLPWTKKKKPEGTKGPQPTPGNWEEYKSPIVDRHGRRITKKPADIKRDFSSTPKTDLGSKRGPLTPVPGGSPGEGKFGKETGDERHPNELDDPTVPSRIKAQNDEFRNLEYSDIDEGRVPSKPIQKQSNEGGVGVDDPEALNDGTPASSQHYRRIKEEEENRKSSLAMKAYANPGKDAQKPIDPDEDGREALSSAETGTGTQAFSSGAVIDISPGETDGVNINTKASGGAGGEGVEGGGDGSTTMVAPLDPLELLPISRQSEPRPEDYDSDLTPLNRDLRKEGGGGGDGGGGGGGVGTSGSFGGGTALSVSGSGGDAVHTDTHGRVTRKRNSNGQEGLDKSSLTKDSMDAGSYEGVSQLPYPQDDNTRPKRTIERHKPGDSEEDDAETRASDQEHDIPMHQQPIGEDYASSYVIAEDEERYSPTEVTEKPEHEIVRRRFIDEDHRLKSVNDNAAEQYTNLSMLSQDLMNHTLGKGDTPQSLGENDAFKVLTANSIQKMDTGRTLVVAGWGNYYIVDREGHRLGIEGMRRAMDDFLKRKEFANMNIFHSGIQVGQILKKFVDANGKEWRTEVVPEGLFVVAAFRTDLEVSKKAMAEVLKGSMRGFSIAGNAKDKKTICEHGKCWTEVTDLEIYEVTLCVTPMNPKSYITHIIQKPDPMVCPECYEDKQIEFDSGLRVK